MKVPLRELQKIFKIFEKILDPDTFRHALRLSAKFVYYCIKLKSVVVLFLVFRKIFSQFCLGDWPLIKWKYL